VKKVPLFFSFAAVDADETQIYRFWPHIPTRETRGGKGQLINFCASCFGILPRFSLVIRGQSLKARAPQKWLSQRNCGYPECGYQESGYQESGYQESGYQECGNQECGHEDNGQGSF